MWHDIIMNVEWNSSDQLEAFVYIAMARNIQIGFYQKTRMLVLPYLHEDGWYFPDYGLLKDESFCSELVKVHYLEIKVDSSVLIKKTLEKFNLQVQEQDFAQKKIEFEEFFPACDQFLNDLFLHYTSVSSIVIIPTKFGTASSYFLEGTADTFIVYLTLRLDKPAVFLVKSLVSVLIQIEQSFDDQQLSQWSVRKHVSDFIANHTKLKHLLPEIEGGSGIHNFLEDYKGEQAEESAKYLGHLGYPLPGSFSYKQDPVFFNGEALRGLEYKEIEILKLLIDRRPEVVNFAEIGDAYWGDEAADKFSLYSIAKIIEKIRKSFEANEVPGRCLQTVRKRGYLLYD